MSTHSVLVLLWMKGELIPSEYISCIYFLFHIVKTFIVAVGDDGMATLLEGGKVVDDKAAEESGTIFQCRFIDDDLCSLGLDTLHHSLNRTLAEVVTVRLHCQAVDSYDTFLLFIWVIIAPVIIVIIACCVQHLVGNEILACAVAFHNRLNKILGDIRIIGKQLLRIFRQAISAIAK